MIFIVVFLSFDRLPPICRCPNLCPGSPKVNAHFSAQGRLCRFQCRNPGMGLYLFLAVSWTPKNCSPIARVGRNFHCFFFILMGPVGGFEMMVPPPFSSYVPIHLFSNHFGPATSLRSGASSRRDIGEVFFLTASFRSSAAFSSHTPTQI